MKGKKVMLKASEHGKLLGRPVLSVHGHKLVVGVSSVRAQVQLKTKRIEGLIQVKPVVAQSPPIGMVWEFGEGIPPEVLSSFLDCGSK
ncbi:hypothetical protein TNCV_754331 [Trichonephila clavipes]|nr:hypothetical protein TNCV_754331 [Trichonephila clavipes]